MYSKKDKVSWSQARTEISYAIKLAFTEFRKNLEPKNLVLKSLQCTKRKKEASIVWRVYNYLSISQYYENSRLPDHW